MPLGRAIDHPNVVASAAQIVAHLLKTGTAEKSGDGDEADDARLPAGAVIKNLPRRPAPKINVEIAQMFCVRADAPFARRHPRGERRGFFRLRIFALDPAAAALRLFFVRRIADDDRDRLVAFDFVGVLPRARNGCEDAGNPALVVFGIAECVRDEHPRRRRRRRPRDVAQLGEHAKLRDGERAELHLESDEPLHRLVDRGFHRTLAFLLGDALRDAPHHSEQKRARARGRISDRDARRREARGLAEARTQHVIDEPHHRADDFRRRVVRAGELAQRVVVHFEKVLVEIEPGVRPTFADLRPIDGVEHAGERAERGLERVLIFRVVGEQAQRGADERAGLCEFARDIIEAACEPDAFRASHEQAERDGLRVAIGESFVVGLGKKKFAPVRGE